MSTASLVRMANQIAAFFNSFPHDEAVEQTKAHFMSFWDPRMRKDLIAHAVSGGAGLSPLALEAARKLPGPR